MISLMEPQTGSGRATRVRTVRHACGEPRNPEEEVSDFALVGRFNGGDETAFIEIVRRYRAKLFAQAFSVLHNAADAEEVAQDSLIRAHRGLAQFRGDAALSTWLHRIALNLSRNRYWYFHRRSRHLTRSFDAAFSDENPTSLANMIATEAPSPAQLASTEDFSELVAGCMEQLIPGQREILTLRNVLECSYEEIAATLNINVGTVKSRIARARAALRELLVSTDTDFAGASTLDDGRSPDVLATAVPRKCSVA